MGHRTTRGRRKQPQGPSKFFVIALALGLILFFLFYAMMLRNPPKSQPGKKAEIIAVGSCAS